MGWSYGHNAQGREVGYSVEATCDYEGCNEKINRGLSYCCGGMHDGETLDNHDSSTCMNTCGKYFCSKHRTFAVAFAPNNDGDIRTRCFEVCEECANDVLKYLGDYSEWPNSYEPPTYSEDSLETG